MLALQLYTYCCSLLIFLLQFTMFKLFVILVCVLYLFFHAAILLIHTSLCLKNVIPPLDYANESVSVKVAMREKDVG